VASPGSFFREQRTNSDAISSGSCIGIVAGEPSGDFLGARLIQALKTEFPGLKFVGVGGPEMIAAGCHTIVPMEKLSVVGLTEVIGKFRELHATRRELVRHFLKNPPILFIGVDYPGFNLGLEEILRRNGIRTAHYVSPQVWAWRTWRVRQIRRAVDRMLVLFPFEVPFYARHGIEATFVGHPLAEEINGDLDAKDVRRRLDLDPDRPTVALLPGSRASEVKALADTFVQTARWLIDRHPDIQFAIPFVSRKTRLLFEAAIKRHEAWDLPITRFHGHSRDVMAAADVILLASGTATLEAMLSNRLMVVTYRVSTVSYWIMRALAHIRLVAMPNHLAGSHLVPELIQRDAKPELLGRAVERYLQRPAYAIEVLKKFRELSSRLGTGSARNAAVALAELIRSSGTDARQAPTSGP